MLNTGGLGDAYARSGRIAEGISLLERGLRALNHGLGTFQLFFRVRLGEAYLLADRLEDASRAPSEP